MTREQKLALIVGFSLVLLVGVLISDHLSRARQAKIASVGPGDAPMQPITPGSSGDTLHALDIALHSPTAPGSASQALSPTGSPTAGSNPASQFPEPSAPIPTTIAQGAGRGTRPDDDSALRKAVESNGGQILVRSDGNSDIILPGAAKVSTLADASYGPPISTIPMTSPVRYDAGSGKSVATKEQFKTHTVQRGETLFQIAAKYYGTGHVWHELAKFNGVTNKDGIVRVGSRLKIPGKDILLGKAGPVETAGGSAPLPSNPTDRAIPGRRQDVPIAKPEIKLATYTVKKGETLGEISKKVLGSSKRWQELADFNQLEDEDSISAGTVLKVPPMRG